MPHSPLVARDLSKTIAARRVVHRVSLVVHPGKVLAVPPTADAAVLLALLAGEQEPDAGSVTGPEHRVHVTQGTRLRRDAVGGAGALLADLAGAGHDPATREAVMDAVWHVSGPVVLATDDRVLLTALGARTLKAKGRTARRPDAHPGGGAAPHRRPEGVSRAALARRAAPRR